MPIGENETKMPQLLHCGIVHFEGYGGYCGDYVKIV